jgi:hypothetical protein
MKKSKCSKKVHLQLNPLSLLVSLTMIAFQSSFQKIITWTKKSRRGVAKVEIILYYYIFTCQDVENFGENTICFSNGHILGKVGVLECYFNLL